MVKITVVGLSQVGKTSIIKSVFANYSLDQIFNLPPTIFREESNPEPDWVDEPVFVVDLGGQEAYLKKHINIHNFTNNDLILFVIDIQEVERYEKTKEYFTNIVNIILEAKLSPLIGILFHKYDPEKRDNLTENLALFYGLVDEVFLENKLKPNIHFSSIKDETTKEAMFKLVIKISFVSLLKQGLKSINPKQWFYTDLTTKEDVSQYLLTLGKNHGLAIRTNFLESVLLNKTPVNEEGSSLLDFQMEQDNEEIRVKVYLEDIPSSNIVSKQEALDHYLTGFSQPLYCKLVLKENEKFSEYLIQAY